MPLKPPPSGTTKVNQRGKPNNLKVLGAIKPKSLNRIAIIG
jgi:hypothetical protein